MLTCPMWAQGVFIATATGHLLEQKRNEIMKHTKRKPAPVIFYVEQVSLASVNRERCKAGLLVLMRQRGLKTATCKSSYFFYFSQCFYEFSKYLAQIFVQLFKNKSKPVLACEGISMLINTPFSCKHQSNNDVYRFTLNLRPAYLGSVSTGQAQLNNEDRLGRDDRISCCVQIGRAHV